MSLLSKYFRITVLLLATQLFTFHSITSQNLIQNGSFESFTNPIDCGSGGFDNYYFTPAPHVLNNWYGYQSPDYFNSSCNPGGFNVPNSYFGNNYSKNGNAYVGLVAYARGGYDKEYIYQQLGQPLQAGHVYCLSFYVNRADRFTYAIKSIGALFSTNIMPVTNGYEINSIPQVANPNAFLTDTTQWVEIQGCFTANGGEQYVTIGNFTSNFNTDTLNTNSTNLVPGREGTSYYYIDNITLYDQLSVGVNELNEGSSINVFPNPTNSILNITINNKEIQSSLIEIKNVLGETVLSMTYSNQINVSELAKGVYFLILKNRIYKFVKE